MIESCLLPNIIILIMTIISIVTGYIKFFRGRRTLYPQIIVAGIGCMAVSRLYRILLAATIDRPDAASIGSHVYELGIAGCFLFLLTANYGQMDGLVDDRSSSFRRYRIIAFVCSLTIPLLWIINTYALGSEVRFEPVYIVLTVSSYYNYKHIFIPDVEYGIIRSLRYYNILALIFGYSHITGIMFMEHCSNITVMIHSVIYGIIIVLIPPVLERGVKRWTA